MWKDHIRAHFSIHGGSLMSSPGTQYTGSWRLEGLFYPKSGSPLYIDCHLLTFPIQNRYIKLGPSSQQSAFSNTWSFSQTSIGGSSSSTIRRNDASTASGRSPTQSTSPVTVSAGKAPAVNVPQVLSIYKQKVCSLTMVSVQNVSRLVD